MEKVREFALSHSYKKICFHKHLYENKNDALALDILNAIKNDYKFCPLNCLYTGDFEASNNDNFAKLKKFYSESWDSIGILQVPHHGSEHNLNCGLYTPPKLCIISAGIKDRYGHPDQQTLKAIHRMGCQYRKVTEKPETKMKFEIIV